MLTDTQLFLEAFFLLLRYTRRIRTSSIRKVFKEVSHFSDKTFLPGKLTTNPDHIIGIIKTADRLIPGTTCLSRALAGHVLLTRNNYSTRLHLGVTKKKDDSLEAHAWLSLDGKVLIGDLPDLTRFQEFPLTEDLSDTSHTVS